MIELPEAMQMLVEACPSFSGKWQAHLDEYGNALYFVASGTFADHLLSLHNSKTTASFPAVALALERMYSEGAANVREFATIGILEGVQNAWMNNGADPAVFYEHLGSEGRWWWDSLSAFWSGKVPYVGFRQLP